MQRVIPPLALNLGQTQSYGFFSNLRTLKTNKINTHSRTRCISIWIGFVEFSVARAVREENTVENISQSFSCFRPQ